MSIPTINAIQAHEKIKNGACLIDIRSQDEHNRHRIAGAICIPADTMAGCDPMNDKAVLIFHCLGGVRTQNSMATLEKFANGREAYILEKGLNGWQEANLPTLKDDSQPLPLQRQVQMIAGSLILLGVVLGASVNHGFYGLSAFVGAGLLVAGMTGFCGMARLLMLLPYNQR